MRIAPAGRLYSPLANEQDTTVPARAQLRTFFLTFGVTGKAPDKCICPLGKVLTNKNLIYLLNFLIYCSDRLLSKNQLASDGAECVARVIIPALAPTLDKSLKEGRTFCQSEYYITTWTRPKTSWYTRNSVSFKKNFIKDVGGGWGGLGGVFLRTNSFSLPLEITQNFYTI